MDWLQIGTTLGIPMLILIGIAWFVATKVWPVAVKQIEFNQQQNREFLASLANINTALGAQTNTIREQTTAIQTQTESIRGMNRLLETLRRGGGSSSAGKTTEKL